MPWLNATAECHSAEEHEASPAGKECKCTVETTTNADLDTGVTNPKSDTDSHHPGKNNSDETGNLVPVCVEISTTELKRECITERGLVSATPGGSGDG